MLYVHCDEIMFRDMTWEHYNAGEITAIILRRLIERGCKTMDDEHTIGDCVFVLDEQFIESGSVIAGGATGQMIKWSGRCPVAVVYDGDPTGVEESALVKWARAYSVDVYAYVPIPAPAREHAPSVG